MRSPWPSLASLLLACSTAIEAPPRPAPAASAPASSSASAPSPAPPLASSASSPPAPALLPDDGRAARTASPPAPPGAPTAARDDSGRIEATVARSRAGLRRCYNEALKQDADLTVDPLGWELRVESDGHVSKATYLCKPALRPELERCLRAVFQSMTLPKQTGTFTLGRCGDPSAPR